MHFVDAKGILTGSGGRYGMNIYRGCTHGCIYCDSRSSCYQFAHPFEDVEVKRNAPELLEAALRRKPDLLLLDEFCLNLDAPAAARVRTRVDAWLKAHPACAAICVAHRPGDVPPGFTRECVLGLGGRG